MDSKKTVKVAADKKVAPVSDKEQQFAFGKVEQFLVGQWKVGRCRHTRWTKSI